MKLKVRKNILFLVCGILMSCLLIGGKADAAHKHKWEIYKTVQPTTTKEGKYYKKCSCGQKKQETIPKKKQTKVAHTHNWTIYKSEAPTCDDTGIYYEKCSCGKTREEKIPKLGHNYVNSRYYPATCTSDAEMWLRCTRCGREVPSLKQYAKKLGHNWLVKSSHMVKKGLIKKYNIEYVCLRCGKTTILRSVKKGTKPDRYL